jgi:hypothetical protein
MSNFNNSRSADNPLVLPERAECQLRKLVRLWRTQERWRSRHPHKWHKGTRRFA